MSRRDTPDAAAAPAMRLDKWLWAARLCKTRSLAAEAIAKGRVRVNGLPAKPGRDLHAGDTIEARIGPDPRTLVVLALSALRGPAPVAQALYQETAQSAAARARAAEARRLATDPAPAPGRPTKRDRRDIDRNQAAWQRWSASLDDEAP